MACVDSALRLGILSTTSRICYRHMVLKESCFANVWLSAVLRILSDKYQIFFNFGGMESLVLIKIVF